MSADLKIHAVPKYWSPEYTMLVFAVFESNSIGSKWCSLGTGFDPQKLEHRIADWKEDEKQEARDINNLTRLSPEEQKVFQTIHTLEHTMLGKAKMDLMREGSYYVMDMCPNVWVGEVSWLKASLLGEREKYIPNPVARVSDIIGDTLPICTPELKTEILKALELPNTTSYDITDEFSVGKFLDDHMGEKLFTISW